MANDVTILGSAGQVMAEKAGYGSAGASRQKRSFKGFDAYSGDPITDINAHNMTLRQRSRVLYMAAPLATSAVRTNRTNVVGCGLELKSRIDANILGLSREEADKIERQIEAEFALWAEDKYACDATGVNNFAGIQQLALIAWLMSGDVFALRKYREPTFNHPYSLRLHLIEADRVSTPMLSTSVGINTMVFMDGLPIVGGLFVTEGRNEETGNLIHDGVEVDDDGMIVAYHICDRHPNVAASSIAVVQKPEWVRVEAVSEDTGLLNIMHIMDTERPEQYRGVPYLAHVIEPLLQSRRYTESELMAALVESFFTVFVTKEAGEFGSPLDDSVNPEDRVSDDDRDLELGPGIAHTLMPGEDIKTADPKRPTSGFSDFVRAISTQVGSALEIPAEVLLKEFTKSYSASRAALLEAWKAFMMRREWLVDDLNRPTYAAWFSEAVALGRLDAPGFFDDPLIRGAWLGSEWTGPSQGQLDPLKEVNAHLLKISRGLETHEQATIALEGGNWDKNIEQLKRENALLLDAGIEINKEGENAEENDSDPDGEGEE